MTNPGNIVRVRARNGGRASVYEANGWAQAYTSGLLEGNGVTQNTVADMKVLVGGSTTKPDVVLAVNPAGYKIALDLIGQQVLTLTAPASNSRISSIVAYTDDLSLATTEDTVTGSPASCGLIVVNGTAAANPVEPTDAQIRTAITSDGATGSQAAYCVIANVTVASGTTVVTNGEIEMKVAKFGSSNFDFTTLIPTNTNEELDTGIEYGGKTVYAQRFTGSVAIAAYILTTETLIGSGIETVIETIGWARPGVSYAKSKIGSYFVGGDGAKIIINGGHYLLVSTTNALQLRIVYSTGGTASYDFVVYYTKL